MSRGERLRAAWLASGLMIYVMDREVGVVEVHADDPSQPPA